MLNIITALPCEAHAIIRHYRLKHLADHHAFSLYRATDNSMQLCLSGIGRVNSAAAVAYSAAQSPTGMDSGWLNFGIAGHREFAVGTVFQAHKVIDDATEKTWYPGLLFGKNLQSDNVRSFDHAQNSYQDQRGIDMEASGFYPTALRFAPAERVQVLKIVSDNPETPSQNINKASVQKLIATHFSPIQSYIDELRDATNNALDPEFEAVNELADSVLHRWTATQHLTHAQQQQCRDRLIKLGLLDLERLKTLDSELCAIPASDSLLHYLEGQLLYVGPAYPLSMKIDRVT